MPASTSTCLYSHLLFFGVLFVETGVSVWVMRACGLGGGREDDKWFLYEEGKPYWFFENVACIYVRAMIIELACWNRVYIEEGFAHFHHPFQLRSKGFALSSGHCHILEIYNFFRPYSVICCCWIEYYIFYA